MHAPFQSSSSRSESSPMFLPICSLGTLSCCETTSAKVAECQCPPISWSSIIPRLRFPRHGRIACPHQRVHQNVRIRDYSFAISTKYLHEEFLIDGRGLPLPLICTSPCYYWMPPSDAIPVAWWWLSVYASHTLQFMSDISDGLAKVR